MRKAVTIVAPHPDDEIIGCYEVLSKSQFNSIVYVEKVDKSREEETTRIADVLNVYSMRFFRGDYEGLRIKVRSHIEDRYYFPDPVYETHPAHRAIGAIGEEFLRKGWDVIFYSINMEAPYIHEVKNTEKKRECLNYLYDSQRSLWEYEKKYILFEGYCRYLMG